MPLIPPGAALDALRGAVHHRSPMPPGARAEPARPARSGSFVPGPPLPLEEVLDGRRSCRRFTDDVPSMDLLDSVLSLAEKTQRAQFPVRRHGDARIRLLLAVGAGAVPHRWEPGGGPPCPVAGQAAVGAVHRMYARAPVLVFLCGSVVRAGTAAYGGLLVRAGAYGHAVWLAARGQGLECSVHGGSSHEVTALARTADPLDRHLFTVALGYPLPAAGEQS